MKRDLHASSHELQVSCLLLTSIVEEKNLKLHETIDFAYLWARHCLLALPSSLLCNHKLSCRKKSSAFKRKDSAATNSSKDNIKAWCHTFDLARPMKDAGAVQSLVNLYHFYYPPHNAYHNSRCENFLAEKSSSHVFLSRFCSREFHLFWEHLHWSSFLWLILHFGLSQQMCERIKFVKSVRRGLLGCLWYSCADSILLFAYVISFSHTNCDSQLAPTLHSSEVQYCGSRGWKSTFQLTVFSILCSQESGKIFTVQEKESEIFFTSFAILQINLWYETPGVRSTHSLGYYKPVEQIIFSLSLIYHSS